MPPSQLSGGPETAGDGTGKQVKTGKEAKAQEFRSHLGPLFEGLLDTLPPLETAWPVEARKKWLQTAASVFDLLYPADDKGDELSIAVTKKSAK
jgi:hypothetical protein